LNFRQKLSQRRKIAHTDFFNQIETTKTEGEKRKKGTERANGKKRRHA